MSLGLFTVDDQERLWFDIDCVPAPPAPFFPKHFVFNVGHSASERFLLLHTSRLDDVDRTARQLLTTGPLGHQQVISAIIPELQKAPAGVGAYARVVHRAGGVWKSESLDYTGSGQVTPNSVTIHRGDLHYVGDVVAVNHAQTHWSTSATQPIKDRLRQAIEYAASRTTNTVLVPVKREPSSIDACVRAFADPNTLLT